MPYIEMPEDIAEEMADLLGIYGAAKEHDDKCDCRVCFCTKLIHRIRDSVKNEEKWEEFPK